MGSAQNALLVGSSAGGVATAIYCDRFRRHFSNTSRVKCLSDGGYFFLSKKHHQENTFLSMFDGLIKLHGSKNALPTSCTSRLSPEMCFFPQNLQADIQTPIFFLMSAFDRI
ncbi:PREDICTED: pectin acetylesterase 7-like [Ipomoea nil]|uniref:pectin acetylesterase 7-like n=1 Tax=Ipomoea nil TaxID=35883 RepID=UPI000901D5DA|nr:PREDICTED: pectin acetylesterase 7-like [Ipomoea nil]